MQDAPPPQHEDVSPYACPSCGTPVASSDPSQAVLQCPECGQQFFAPTSDEGSTHDEQTAREDDADEQARREAELSELRISQIASLRRGAIRTRSWFIVGAAVCLVGAGQFIYFAVERYRLGQRLSPLRDLACAAALLIVAPYLMRRVRQLGREINQSRLAEPTTPPDFSTLSNGSQRWTNLEKLSGADETE